MGTKGANSAGRLACQWAEGHLTGRRTTGADRRKYCLEHAEKTFNVSLSAETDDEIFIAIQQAEQVDGYTRPKEEHEHMSTPKKHGTAAPKSTNGTGHSKSAADSWTLGVRLPKPYQGKVQRILTEKDLSMADWIKSMIDAAGTKAPNAETTAQQAVPVGV